MLDLLVCFVRSDCVLSAVLNGGNAFVPLDCIGGRRQYKHYRLFVFHGCHLLSKIHFAHELDVDPGYLPERPLLRALRRC